MLNASFDFTKDTINEKVKNPFWRNFIIWWITWNWKVWYITFFVSEEIVWNKISSISKMYDYIDFYNLFPLLWFILNWVLIPAWISYLMIYQIPKNITNRFLKQHKLNKEAENKILKDEIESETKVIEAQKENLQKKEELENLKEKKKYEEWDKEYKKIESFTLHTLSKLIYSNQWDVDDYLVQKLNWTHDSIDKQIMILDTSWLINSWNWFRNFSITEKWKYFLKKYSEQKQ